MILKLIYLNYRKDIFEFSINYLRFTNPYFITIFVKTCGWKPSKVWLSDNLIEINYKIIEFYEKKKIILICEIKLWINFIH